MMNPLTLPMFLAWISAAGAPPIRIIPLNLWGWHLWPNRGKSASGPGANDASSPAACCRPLEDQAHAR